MNIYVIWQSYVRGHDTYDSAVVVASTAAKAKKINPSGYKDDKSGSWPSTKYGKKKIKSELIGVAKKKHKEGTIICASFNAG